MDYVTVRTFVCVCVRVPVCADQFEILFVFRWSEHSQNHAGRQQGPCRAAAVWLWSRCLLPQRPLLSLDTVNWIWLFTQPFVGPGFLFRLGQFWCFFLFNFALSLVRICFLSHFLLHFSLSYTHTHTHTHPQTHTHTHTHTPLYFLPPPSMLFFFYPLLSWLNPLVWSIIDDPRCLEGSGENPDWLHPRTHHTHTLDTHHLLHPARSPLLSFQDQS